MHGRTTLINFALGWTTARFSLRFQPIVFHTDYSGHETLHSLCFDGIQDWFWVWFCIVFYPSNIIEKLHSPIYIISISNRLFSLVDSS
jgi:hypothetical protein